MRRARRTCRRSAGCSPRRSRRSRSPRVARSAQIAGEHRRAHAAVLQRRIGRHRADPAEAVHRVAAEADRGAVGVASRERRAEYARPRSSSGTQCGYAARREVVRARHRSLARRRRPAGGVASERRVDRHVRADPVALEAERLEQHAGAGVQSRRRARRSAGPRSRAGGRARRAPGRARRPRCTSSLPVPLPCSSGCTATSMSHAATCAPKRCVCSTAAPRSSPKTRRPMTVVVRAEAEVRELVGGQPLLRHRRLAQRRERVGGRHAAALQLAEFAEADSDERAPAFDRSANDASWSR